MGRLLSDVPSFPSSANALDVSTATALRVSTAKRTIISCLLRALSERLGHLILGRNSWLRAYAFPLPASPRPRCLGFASTTGGSLASCRGLNFDKVLSSTARVGSRVPAPGWPTRRVDLGRIKVSNRGCRRSNSPSHPTQNGTGCSRRRLHASVVVALCEVISTRHQQGAAGARGKDFEARPRQLHAPLHLALPPMHYLGIQNGAL
mmetsp:Transcript_174927/g.560933  ORF Transcript_174927/g.560933 Transcript_174927/m.560933 type:complete len:206 (-) Transcript_174927:594-1211(-)